MIRTKSDIVQTDMITRRAPLILAWEKEHSLIFSYDHLEADKAQVIVLNPQKITKKTPLETRYAGQFFFTFIVTARFIARKLTSTISLKSNRFCSHIYQYGKVFPPHKEYVFCLKIRSGFERFGDNTQSRTLPLSAFRPPKTK